MKKTLLLLIILLTAYISNAQSNLTGSENVQAKSQQLVTPSMGTIGAIENIKVYPNPVVDVLKVSVKSNRKGTALISVFNNIGILMFDQQTTLESGSNVISIDLKNKTIGSGVYFLKCEVDNQVYTRKLIVK